MANGLQGRKAVAFINSLLVNDRTMKSSFMLLKTQFVDFVIAISRERAESSNLS
jgi:hypothetical protein